jgi:hypothetical protein
VTLTELITYFEKYESDRKIPLGFGDPHSYRGNYEDVAFEPVKNTTVGETLKWLRSAVDCTFQGYKGGEFKMRGWSKCWLAEYGKSGKEIDRKLFEGC